MIKKLIEDMGEAIIDLHCKTDIETIEPLANVFVKVEDFLTRLEQVDLEETTKFIKNFIPLDEPNCSACMYYTESDCTQEVKGKCRLYELQNLLDILKGVK